MLNVAVGRRWARFREPSGSGLAVITLGQYFSLGRLGWLNGLRRQLKSWFTNIRLVQKQTSSGIFMHQSLCDAFQFLY